MYVVKRHQNREECEKTDQKVKSKSTAIRDGQKRDTERSRKGTTTQVSRCTQRGTECRNEKDMSMKEDRNRATVLTLCPQCILMNSG